MTVAFGAIGGAGAWAMLNAIYVLIGVPLTHTRLLRGEARRWLVEDTALPFAAAVCVVFLGRLLLRDMADLAAIGLLGVVLLGAVGASVLAAPELRHQAQAGLRAT